MELTRGDIVTIAPTGDFSKPRPALILQAHFLQGMETITLVPLTTDLLRQPAVRIPVDPTPENGLNKPSEIMPDNIQTLLIKRVGKVIGKVDARTMRRVDASVAAYLGLNISL